ncbi:MAG: hypothetical protein EG824_07285 [Deltaproteobacteria bacterium]|nr:hypothetical protein [Deltaproteobacteria bacterium]
MKDMINCKLTLMILGMVLFTGSLACAETPMSNYSIKPPFIQETIKSNLMLLLDSSGSMYDLAYNNSTGAFCYDNSYINSMVCSNNLTAKCTADSQCGTGNTCIDRYPGYFDQSRFYAATIPSGQTAPGVPYAVDTTAANATFSTFRDVGATMPSATCQFKSAYLCYDDATKTFIVSGKFLNWLTMSKMDIQKQILTGGKFDTGHNVLVGESRGCVGHDFVKELPETDWTVRPLVAGKTINLTFGVRGDISADVRVPSQGGLTRIDVYKGNYDQQACQDAIDCWVNKGSGCQSLTDNCIIDGGGTGGNPIFNHALQLCWQNEGNLPPMFANAGHIQTIFSDCISLTPAQRLSLTPGDQAYICLRDALMHNPGTTTWPVIQKLQPYFLDGGYAGACLDPLKTYNKNDKPSLSETLCLQEQLYNYCSSFNQGDVIDPSTGAENTTETGNIPGSMIDAGLGTQMGDPLRTYHVRVESPSPGPTGVIQQFKNQIRVGAMVINTVGSKSECSDTNPLNSCNRYPGNKDAGRIISFVGDAAGDHGSGLVKGIDDIAGNTWTPFAEMFYNAIAYYVKDTSLYSLSASAIAAPLNNPDGTATDSYSDKNPVQYKCQANNILIISDGASTTDRNSTMTTKVTDGSGFFRDPATTGESATCGTFQGSPYLHDLAYFARKRNIFNPSETCVDNNGKIICDKAKYITTFAVFNSANTSTSSDVCDPNHQMSLTATNGGTSLYKATNPLELKDSLEDAFKTIAAGSASGTAASIVSNRGQSGANLITAIFYPEREFGVDESVRWIGDLQNYWYYFDPFLANSSIREDTYGDKVLDISKDYIIDFIFKDNKTLAEKYLDPASKQEVEPDALTALWKAGLNLYKRDLTSSPRKILINKDNNKLQDGSFFTLNNSLLSDETALTLGWSDVRNYLQANTDTDALRIMKYVSGYEVSGARKRWVNGYDGLTGITEATAIANGKGVWKLGDIITSTPKVQSDRPISGYHIDYGDSTYKSFVATTDYKNRGTVYVGANDGMLHAFNLGKVVARTSGTEKAELTNTATQGLGDEKWAFIPHNALPYLRYFTDAAYSHLYYVDNTTLLVDASIEKPTGCGSSDYWNCDKKESSWRTVLIGGMGLGGASRAANDASCSDCVKAPINGTGFTELGLSSFFALDVSDQDNPKLLWEFSNPDLGYTLSEPAIVRINGMDGTFADPDKNGRWFVVFASGPTGPIDPDSQQFLARSDKSLKLFIVDLNAKPDSSGKLTKDTDYWVIDTGIDNAFGGSLSTNAMDTDKSNKFSTGIYSTDVVYVGYAKEKGSSGTWTDGGLLRLVTKEDLNPANWVVSKVIEGVGPVTASIDRLYDDIGPSLWLYFGTGRYFYKKGTELDSSDNQMRLFGIKEPCYTTAKDINPACTEAISWSTSCTDGVDECGQLVNQSTTIHSSLGSNKGWYIDLDDANVSTGFAAERVITTPSARTNGLVQFTSYKPTSDPCGFGGETLFWFVDYATGGLAPPGTLKGKITIQLSTGAIVVVDLSKIDLSTLGRGGRQMKIGVGKPPSPPPPADALKKPVKKILQIQEK